VQTRLWLKSSVFLSSLHGAIGMPWEIFRLTHLAPQPRPIDVYTKSGSLPGYAAYVDLVPEYKVGITVDAAGDDSSQTAAQWLLDAAMEAIVPALEEEARAQARDRYVRRYGSAETSKLASSSDMSIVAIVAITSADADGEVAALDVRAYPVGEDHRWRLVFETPRREGGG